MVVHLRNAEDQRQEDQGQWGPYLGEGDLALVEHVLRKCKALDSIPRTRRKKDKNHKNRQQARSGRACL